MNKLQVCFLITCLIVFSHTTYAVEFSLFGDISLSANDSDDGATSFNLGQLDLFAEHEVSETSRVTTEIVFEDPGGGFQVDVERLYIEKVISDGFSVAGGRFHTPLGMWNTNFHHGSLIQDTIARPSFLEFEDAQQGIFPSHVVGFYFDGKGKNWSYQIALGNNATLDTQGNATNVPLELEVRNTNDPSDEKIMVARGSVKFGKGRSELGIFAMSNHIAESGRVNLANPLDSALVEFGESLFEQRTAGIDFKSDFGRFYIFAEYFYVNTEDNPDINDTSGRARLVRPNPQDYSTTAYYAQLGMRATERLTVTYRHENLSFDNNNTYLDLLGIIPISHNIIGLNYKLEESHAIKFEVHRTNPDVGESVTTFITQWFFLLI